MIGILLISHGNLAESMVATAQMILGKKDNIKSICLESSHNHEQKRKELFTLIDELDFGSGVILLTDMFGGSPSNLAMSALGVKKVEVLAGFNLPMLIKIIEIRDHYNLSEIAETARDTGKKYIQMASSLLEINIRD
jgi:PTS system mannose-specific IIA component